MFRLKLISSEINSVFKGLRKSFAGSVGYATFDAQFVSGPRDLSTHDSGIPG